MRNFDENRSVLAQLNTPSTNEENSATPRNLRDWKVILEADDVRSQS